MKRLVVLLLLLLLPSAMPHQASSQPILTDVQAKLAIIHNFMSRYVQWPGRYSLEHNSQIYICTYGVDEVVESMRLLEKASTQDLRVFVTSNPALSMAHECHVVYIASTEKANVSHILKTVRLHPILTVSPLRNFASKGGMVELVTDIQLQGTFEKQYIRYIINLNAMKRHKINLEPDAVEMAKEVLR